MKITTNCRIRVYVYYFIYLSDVWSLKALWFIRPVTSIKFRAPRLKLIVRVLCFNNIFIITLFLFCSFLFFFLYKNIYLYVLFGYYRYYEVILIRISEIDWNLGKSNLYGTRKYCSLNGIMKYLFILKDLRFLYFFTLCRDVFILS